MPRKRRSSSPFELYDDDLDEDASSQSSHNANMPVQRNAANARERARMRVLSSAFGRLKTKLPNIPPDTKLSKLDTLRLATMYIKQLKSAVESNGVSYNADHFDATLMTEHLQQNGVHSMNWPFGFHNAPSSGRHNVYPAHTNTDWSHSQESYSKQTRYEQITYDEQQQLQQQQQQQEHQQQQHWYGCTTNYDLNQQPTSFNFLNKLQNNQMERIHQQTLSTAATHLQATHTHIQNITQTTLH